MNEAAPIIESHKEELIITQENRDVLMGYLRASSDSAIGEDLESATDKDAALAEELLACNLPASDAAENRHYAYPDSNYNSDVALRTAAFEQAGIENNGEIRIVRHNIMLGGLGVKIIDLESERKDEESGEWVKGRVPNGVIFFGKLIFEAGEPKYVMLTAEEKEKIAKFVENK